MTTFNNSIPTGRAYFEREARTLESERAILAELRAGGSFDEIQDQLDYVNQLAKATSS